MRFVLTSRHVLSGVLFSFIVVMLTPCGITQAADGAKDAYIKCDQGCGKDNSACRGNCCACQGKQGKQGNEDAECAEAKDVLLHHPGSAWRQRGISESSDATMQKIVDAMACWVAKSNAHVYGFRTRAQKVAEEKEAADAVARKQASLDRQAKWDADRIANDAKQAAALVQRKRDSDARTQKLREDSKKFFKGVNKGLDDVQRDGMVPRNFPRRSQGTGDASDRPDGVEAEPVESEHDRQLDEDIRKKADELRDHPPLPPDTGADEQRRKAIGLSKMLDAKSVAGDLIARTEALNAGLAQGVRPVIPGTTNASLGDPGLDQFDHKANRTVVAAVGSTNASSDGLDRFDKPSTIKGDYTPTPDLSAFDGLAKRPADRRADDQSAAAARQGAITDARQIEDQATSANRLTKPLKDGETSGPIPPRNSRPDASALPPGTLLHYVNGVHNTPAEALQATQNLADKTGNTAQLRYWATGTGVVPDAVRAAAAYGTGVAGPTLNPLAGGLHDDIRHEVESGEPYYLVAHSAGTIDAKNAVLRYAAELSADSNLTPAQRQERLDRIHIVAVGSATGSSGWPKIGSVYQVYHEDDGISRNTGPGDFFNLQGGSVWEPHNFNNVYLPQINGSMFNTNGTTIIRRDGSMLLK